MHKLRIVISIITFSSLLIGTSIIKNQSRETEKKIFKLNRIIALKEKDYNESQLDFFYLTSPSVIEKKVEHLDKNNYIPMEHSNIFLSLSDFLALEKKIVIQNNQNEKKTEKK